MLHVLDGQVVVTIPGATQRTLGPGGFAYCRPDSIVDIRAASPARLNIFEKRYAIRSGTSIPDSFCGDERDIAGAPFLGDANALLKVLLPSDARFDLAVNIFTFQPGTTLPLVEVHVMEHGLLMLEGQGVYRLGDDWYPVRAGDVIWMAAFCPQWFVAMGKEPARYLYYKDVNRDPLEQPA